MDAIQLKTSSILNVPLQTYIDEFVFIVNGQEFKTNRLVADLLSPKISRIHLNDPTINHFTINTQYQGDFLQFLQLTNFEQIIPSASNICFLNEVVDQLGNENFHIIEPELKVEFTVDNICEFIKQHENGNMISNKLFNTEIEFISSHFTEVINKHKDEMYEFKELTLYKIISSSKLRLNEEDDLLRFINEIYKRDARYAILYENVIFKNATEDCMTEFISIFDYNDLDKSIWSSLSARLESGIKDANCENFDRYEKPFSKIITFIHDSNNEFNGIIKYLTDKTGGNIHDNGTIEITSDPFKNTKYRHPKNVLDFSKDSHYDTGDTGENAWVCFDFKDKEIEISKYTIKSPPNNNGTYIKNWVIEISNNGKDWVQIDQHSNYVGLNSSNAVQTFEVSPNKFSRFCRFRHTGEYYGYPELVLRINSIEFYGRLKE